MQNYKLLSFMSLIIGVIGFFLFIVHKSMQGEKTGFLNYLSKLLIALGIILLNISVILMSKKCNENYTTKKSKKP